MGTAVGDLDGDGLPDLIVTNFYGESTSFFKNMGKGIFADRTSAIGLAGPSRYLVGFGIVLFDANNDGRLDLAQTNGHVIDHRPDFPLDMPGLLLIGGDHGRLVDVTPKAGQPGASRGSAAHWPRAISTMTAASTWYRCRRTRRWSSSTTRPRAGRPRRHRFSWREPGPTATAWARSLRVTAGGRHRRAWRYGGGSYQSASDPRLHFGLGQDRIEEVEVRWPSGQVDRFGHLGGRPQLSFKGRNADANGVAKSHARDRRGRRSG